jgi:cystathionine gamma-synthase
MRFETRAIHSGLKIGNPSNSIVPPISPSTIFEIDAKGRNSEDLHYTRLGNPNRIQFEKVITSLEEGVAAAAFSSGIAAATALLQSSIRVIISSFRKISTLVTVK